MVKAINKKNQPPLYTQAIKAIITMIENSELLMGSKLPPESEFADMLGISRSTLREALSHLEAYGIVSRQQGKGTFVCIPNGREFLGGLARLEPFRLIAERVDKSHTVEERIVEFDLVFPEIAKDLRVPKNTKINRIRVVESVDGIPCMYIEDYLIADRIQPGGMADYSGSMLTYLIEERKPSLSYSHTKLFAIKADEKVAEKLNLTAGHPVLHLKEFYYDTVGEILGVAFLYLISDLFYFYVTRRVMPTN